ncbi:MAG: hypothetical protein QJR03_04035 [Sphaerobacter sp.]|nr:hypothetical protein [Sphaerobacter sp.]
MELPDLDAHYDLEVTAFDPAAGHVAVAQRVTVRSRQGPLSALSFTVIPAVYGFFQLDQAAVDGQPVVPEVRNAGFTLRLPIPAREMTTVGSAFTLALRQVPNEWYGSGLDGEIVRLGYWFPIISDEHPYPSTADPAYTRVARFDVRIPVPAGYTLAYTGEEVRRSRCPPGPPATTCGLRTSATSPCWPRPTSRWAPRARPPACGWSCTVAPPCLPVSARKRSPPRSCHWKASLS